MTSDLEPNSAVLIVLSRGETPWNATLDHRRCLSCPQCGQPTWHVVLANGEHENICASLIRRGGPQTGRRPGDTNA